MRRSRSQAYPALEAGRFLPGVDMPLWRMPAQREPTPAPRPPRPDLLFHSADDPAQEHNLAEARPDVVERLTALLREHALTVQAPDEQWLRLGL